MNANQLQSLRQGDSGCPSDWALDCLHAGELPPAESDRLAAHVKGCELCPARMAARTAGFAQFADVDPRPLLAGVRRRLDAAEKRAASTGWLRRLGFVLAPVAAAAAAMAVFIMVKQAPSALPPSGDEPGSDEIRTKGGVGFHVYRLVGKRSAEAVSGDQFASGERLRFAVDLPRAGQLAVIGVEASGTLYSAWPSAASGQLSTQLPAGRAQELPGAVALDNSAGSETLYLVHCPGATSPPVCSSGGASARPLCPESCSLVPFVINKGP